MSLSLPVRICNICKSPVRLRKLVYHWFVETAPPSIENMAYFHKTCYQNRTEHPNFRPLPDSAPDPWGSFYQWFDRMVEQWPLKKEVEACEAKPASKKQAAYTQDEPGK